MVVGSVFRNISECKFRGYWWQLNGCIVAPLTTTVAVPRNSASNPCFPAPRWQKNGFSGSIWYSILLWKSGRNVRFLHIIRPSCKRAANKTCRNHLQSLMANKPAYKPVGNCLYAVYLVSTVLVKSVYTTSVTYSFPDNCYRCNDTLGCR
jgi:hypothetical protein